MEEYHQIEKNCKNCKFFKRHYVKSNTLFRATIEGHCINGEIPRIVRKNNMPCNNVCEKWESDKEVKEERKETIKEVLKNMRTTLIHIENILKDDLNQD